MLLMWIARVVLPLLLVANAAGGAAANVSRQAASPPLAATANLLIADRPDDERWDGLGFVRLDPETLEDLGPGGNVKSAASTIMAPRDWALSADGSTLVSFESAWNAETRQVDYSLVVRAGLLGPERGRFVLPEALGFPRLSPDGRRVVVQARDERGLPRPGVSVLDTGDGHVLTQAPQLTLDGGWSEIDPSGQRLVRVEPPPEGSQDVPLRVRVLDLLTSSELAHLELAWPAASWPSVSLAPDGRRLALLESSSQVVTIVNMERPEVERTVSLNPPPPALTRLLEFSSLLPRTAYAKPEHGGILQAAFTADSEGLYVFGAEAIAVGPDRWSERGLGVRLLDLNQERIVASGLSDQFVGRVLPLADGQATYAFGLASQEDPQHLSWGAHVVLRRLDPLTLDILASREFIGSRTLLVWAGTLSIAP
jgi:hypothetical protein